MKRPETSRTVEDLSDIEIMDLARKEKIQAFGVLVRRYQESLLNFFRRLGVYADAEDLVQETFLRIYRHRHDYEPKARFRTFLYRVSRTVWIDWVRRQARRDNLLNRYEEDIATKPPPGFEYRPGSKMDVQIALESLPEKLRLVVVMRVYQGLKYEEIAEALEIPEGTAKSRMHLAIERLREFMYVGVEANGFGR